MLFRRRLHTHRLLTLALFVALSASAWSAETSVPSRKIQVRHYFHLYGSADTGFWNALGEPENNDVLNASLAGTTPAGLESLGVADGTERLKILRKAGLVNETDGTYRFAFPVIAGDKRDILTRTVHEAADALFPFTQDMAGQVLTTLDGRKEMLFHVLWSIIMDGRNAWDTAQAKLEQRIPTGDTSIENRGWLIYPNASGSVGTNYYSSIQWLLSITQSYATPQANAIARAIEAHEADLLRAIRESVPVDGKAALKALGQYGLVDDAGNIQLFSLQADSTAASAYRSHGTHFGSKMMHCLDVPALAEALDVSPGIALLIAYHEVCWKVLQDLAKQGNVKPPKIVRRPGVDSREAVQLVSLILQPAQTLTGQD